MVYQYSTQNVESTSTLSSSSMLIITDQYCDLFFVLNLRSLEN